MIEVLASLLTEGRAANLPARLLPARLIAYALTALLLLAAAGFLIAALYETYLGLTDRVAAPLLVAATLAAAAALILLALWTVRAIRAEQRTRDEPEQEAGDDVIALVSDMGAAIENEKLPPFAAVGLALAAGLARGIRD